MSYALWIVLQKRALRSMSPLQVTAWGTWFGALIALPFGHGLPHALGDLSSAELWELAGLGLVVSTVPFLLWSWVLQRMDASLARARAADHRPDRRAARLAAARRAAGAAGAAGRRDRRHRAW